ncbi:MAG: six-hairpin glycosidase-like protein, partial [Armatimonadetes bacterium]|nr:six-hairpin glycosidase-like protein [Armatimonadota bacterium]
METPEPTRWYIDPDGDGIVWNVGDADNPANGLPHSDHVEMSGSRVSVIVRYRVDEARRVFIERDIFFPQLRIRQNDVRGYLRRVYDDRLLLPRFVIDGKEWFPDRAPIERVTFDGVLTLHYAPSSDGICFRRSITPSLMQTGFVESWDVVNRSQRTSDIFLPRFGLIDSTFGVDGDLMISVNKNGNEPIRVDVLPGDSFSFPLVFEAVIVSFSKQIPSGQITSKDATDVALVRRDFANRIQTDPAHIAFSCPDPEINTLFAFCKLRAAESLFETDLMGLVHSPGGGNFYGGIWANDQCEYANPFFAFLNDADTTEASVNCYRHFAKHMGEDYAPLPSSFEMGGHMPFYKCGDRGDAAMIASGLSRYLLVRGDHDLAAELYPALSWCNEYNRRKTDSRGVVLSDTDELEGRFPTGDANLSTSVLAYDGYRMG